MSVLSWLAALIQRASLHCEGRDQSFLRPFVSTALQAAKANACRAELFANPIGNGCTITCGAVAMLFSASTTFAGAVDLPTDGHVYFVRQHEGRLVLVAASAVLVLADRVNACNANKWLLAEASSTSIDSYLVRTDSAGLFHIPPRRYDHVCSGVLLVGTAMVPGHLSLTGRAFFASYADPKGSVYARVDKNRDVFLTERQPSPNRLFELRSALSFSATVTAPMIQEIYRELRPELEPLLARYSVGAHAFDARVLREGLQHSLLISDWKKMNPNERLQLIESMLDDYRDYNLKAKPKQSAQYYADELDRTVERYGTGSVPKILLTRRYSTCLRPWPHWTETGRATGTVLP